MRQVSSEVRIDHGKVWRNGGQWTGIPWSAGPFQLITSMTIQVGGETPGAFNKARIAELWGSAEPNSMPPFHLP
jgi:hypothetical protein